MNLIELFLLSIGLSMDAFAVAVCIGLTMSKFNIKKMLTVGLYFGLFQAGMPIIGFMIATQFAGLVTQFSHWIAFGLLVFLGAKMIWGSLTKANCKDRTCAATPCADRKCPIGRQEVDLVPSKMIPLALATSIDAMAVGVSFAFLRVSIAPAVSLIGVTTLVISMIGVKIGNVFGAKFRAKAELAGGIILVLMGVRVLLEHLH
ncbi:MAG: manganese efflux pump MntP family protein [Defluviitaleaceae bacterium]|nr:manganese efflux pump MntP family protein [Defluviitaleaceae bacterium]